MPFLPIAAIQAVFSHVLRVRERHDARIDVGGALWAEIDLSMPGDNLLLPVSSRLCDASEAVLRHKAILVDGKLH